MKDLKDIVRITNDKQEMICIGKELAEVKSDKYPPNLIENIRSLIRQRRPQIKENEIDDLLYITIYHYWTYGSTYEECLNYDFDSKTHEEKKEYMTFRVRLLYMDHLSRKEDKHLLFNKYETYQLFKKYYKRDVILCATDDDYPVFLDFVKKHPVFVVKPTDMSGARGVHKASIEGLNEEQLKDFYTAMLGESQANHEKYLTGKEKSVVLEELIDQAEEMAAFNPESVNGVRLPTVKVDGKIHFYQPWFKVGRGGHFITSAVFGSMDAGIDAETGIVDTPGITEDGEEWENHPDSHLPIKGFQIPHWKELLEIAEECALQLPTIGYVGWDFVLSKKGWCIMEGNYSGDFMWQMYRKKGMKKEFEELIGWKLDKEFWWQ